MGETPIIVKVLLMGLMITLYSFQSFCCKKYTDHYPGKPSLASPVFTAVSGITVAFISLCFMGFRFDAEWRTLLLGALNAAAITGYNYFMVKCSQSGPYTILMVFAIAGGIVVPTLAALIGFGVGLSWLKWIGVAVVIGGVYLASYRKNEGTVNFKVFIPCCIGLALCNGAYAALTDIQQRLSGADEKEEMVCITYFLAAIASLVMILIRERGSLKCFGQNKLSLTFLLITSVIVGLAINLLVIVIAILNDITLLHTLNNSGILIVSAILSFIFLKEKITRLNIVGYAVMCAALVLVTFGDTFVALMG